jgi:hypothetical protein
MEGELLHKVLGERVKTHHITSTGNIFDGEDEPEKFLISNLWNNDVENKSVGFKYFPYFSVSHDIKRLFDFFKANDVLIIHIKRRNKLNLWMSYERAVQKKQFAIFEGQAESKIDVIAKVVQPKELHEFFNESCRIDNEIIDTFTGENYLEVDYDHLANHTQDVMNIIFNKLKEQPIKIDIKMKKQNNEGPDSLFKNIDELKNYFKGTPYLDFFEH